MTQHEQSGDEYYSEERCFITELHNTPQDPNASIARARVEPGVTTKWHKLNGTVERYLILGGTGIAETGDGGETAMSAGDSLTIPADVTQRITNTGSDDLIFLCVCTPRFEWENYSSLED